MIVRTLPLLAPLALLVACAAPKDAPSFAQVQAQAPRSVEGKAILYVYREYAAPTAWNVSFLVDGKPVASLPQESFSWVYLSPGRHDLKSEWFWLAGAPTVKGPADFVAGNRYFIQIRGSAQTVSGVGSEPWRMMIEMSSTLSGEDESAAIQQLERCCRFIAPVATDF